MMKNLRTITAILLTTVLAFTSCQDEIDNENGTNPNTNSATSPTASNLERSSMYDGSFDDFIDGMSCSSILFPYTATINGTEITLTNKLDYSLVLNILGEIINDNDVISFQFPLTVKLSNYTEVQVTNQSEYDALMNACEEAENNAEDSINCLDISFPFSILTYNLSAEQTGSVIIESEQQLYAYINNLESDELFAVNYPITASFNGQSNTTFEISSDVELTSKIEECVANDETEEEAEENAENLETILVEGTFKVQSFITAGTNTANQFADYTIDFAENLSCTAENTANTAISDVEGTYQVASETEVYLNLLFSSNATLELLNHNWEVISYSQNTIELKSTTNAAITLVLAQI